MREIAREHPTDYFERTVIAMMPLRDYMVGQVRTALWILLGAVGMVLLIACTNVAHLALARASGRAKEMAVRSALGAGRARLVRQMLSESVLLAILGGLAGVFLAWWGTAALAGLEPEGTAARARDPHRHCRCCGSHSASAFSQDCCSGWYPALRASRVDPNETLKDMGRSTEGRSRFTYRNALVTIELALAFVLAMGAGLLGKSLVRLMNVDPGYDPHNVLTAGVFVYGDRYKKPDAELNFYDQVDAATARHTRHRERRHVQQPAMAELRSRRVSHPGPPAGQRCECTFGGPIFCFAGLLPGHADSVKARADVYRQRPHRGAVGRDHQRVLRPHHVSRAARPIGQTHPDWAAAMTTRNGRRSSGSWVTSGSTASTSPSNMEAYIPLAQNLDYGFNLAVRTSGDPRRLEETVRQVILGVDNTQPVFHVRPLEDYIAESLAARRFTLMLLGLFGALALLLAAVGIYGVISYAVSLRTRELGIRMALGAARKDVLQMVLRQGLKLAATGLVLGFAASIVLTRFLTSLLFQVKPADGFTLAAVALTLAAVALLANYLPARRASRVDPNEALRCE